MHDAPERRARAERESHRILLLTGTKLTSPREINYFAHIPTRKCLSFCNLPPVFAKPPTVPAGEASVASTRLVCPPLPPLPSVPPLVRVLRRIYLRVFTSVGGKVHTVI